MSRSVKLDTESLRERQARAQEADRISHERADQYWACSVCNSGGNPLTVHQAHSGAAGHAGETSHFTVWGTIKATAAHDDPTNEDWAFAKVVLA